MTEIKGAGAGDGILRMRGVDYSIGGRRILDGVDLEVFPGEVLALIGPNGAGKSTALAVLAGDLRPDSGEVLLEGRAIRSMRADELGRRRSVLLQQSAVSFSYTAREVVAMARLPWQGRLSESELALAAASGEDNGEDGCGGGGWRGSEDDIVMDALLSIDAMHFADRDVTTLSGGEQARVALARVLAQRCRIVLLDEPTDALDIGHQERVLQIAKTLARAGGAVLAVLHDLGLAAAYADRIVLMDAGGVVAAGPPADVLTSGLLSSVYRYPIEVVPHPSTGAPLILPVRPFMTPGHGAPPRRVTLNA